MTDTDRKTMDELIAGDEDMYDVPETGWLIYKGGRGWYRPNSQGYTGDPAEAGRYTRAYALSYSHPNGMDGPRDGMFIKHETEVPGACAPPPDGPVTDTQGDIEAANRLFNGSAHFPSDYAAAFARHRIAAERAAYAAGQRDGWSKGWDDCCDCLPESVAFEMNEDVKRDIMADSLPIKETE